MSLTDRNYEEKRDFIRMTMNATAKMTVNGSQAIEVTCIDLSASGMSIHADTAVAEGTQVHVVIDSPNDQFRSMDAKGRVLRCQPLESGEFDLGIEIDKFA